jgi:Flp pilus assembly pilin Flp
MKSWIGLYRDEDGQASAEYILMLALGVAMAITVARKLVKPMMERLAEAYSARVSELFSKASLHSLKIGR